MSDSQELLRELDERLIRGEISETTYREIHDRLLSAAGPYQQPRMPQAPGDGGPFPSASSFVCCPICGRQNPAINTFHCPKCRQSHLCIEHRESDSPACRKCAGSRPLSPEAPPRPSIPLGRAALQGNLAEVRAHLYWKSDANEHCNEMFGRTPLHQAASCGNVEILTLLLKHGAHVNATDQRERTPLHTASRTGHAAAAKILLDVGADIAAADNRRNTPLHLAAYDGHLEVVRLLLDRKADVNARNDCRVTPLLGASHYGHASVITTLLERGADPNAADNELETSLHSAAGRNYSAIVELLLRHGADPNARNADGESPRNVALAMGNASIAATLRRFRAR